MYNNDNNNNNRASLLKDEPYGRRGYFRLISKLFFFFFDFGIVKCPDYVPHEFVYRFSRKVIFSFPYIFDNWSWILRQHFSCEIKRIPSRCVLVGPTRTWKQTAVGISWTSCNPYDKCKHKYELLNSAYQRIPYWCCATKPHIVQCTRWIQISDPMHSGFETYAYCVLYEYIYSLFWNTLCWIVWNWMQ